MYRRVIAQEEEIARGIGTGWRGVAFLCFVFCERGSVCYFRLEMEGKQLTEDNRNVLMEERKARTVEAQNTGGDIQIKR